MHHQIKLASFKEIELMMDWAAIETWNPGINDASAFQMIDLNGFFIGYVGDEPISCISTVKYNSEFGFLGLYIVKPQYRGKGFGYQIWQHAMHYAGQINIGLDGVPAQQPNYKKSGFKLAHKNVRYFLAKNSFENFRDNHIILAKTLPLYEIAEYDRSCFPCERHVFLTSWLLMSNATALVYYDRGIKGYGVIRACRKGYKIGPLFADDFSIATALFKALANTVKDQSGIYLDIPETNPDAIRLVQEFTMEPVFETARMYTKNPPTLSLNKIFGITTFEMG